MEEATRVVVEPRGVDAGRGLAWWTESWALFTKNALMWIVLGVIVLVIFGVLGIIPVLGGIAACLLAPVFIAGWLIATRKAEAGAAPEVGDLFAGFNQKVTQLFILGALLLLGMVVIAVVVGALGLGAAAGMMLGGAHRNTAGMGAAMGAGMLALLVTLVLGALIAMAFWFAPALVVFRGVPPADALKASFAANMKNIGAFLLYGVIYIVAAIVASIPFGLGWIVLVPVAMIGLYVSYKDIFGLDAVVVG